MYSGQSFGDWEADPDNTSKLKIVFGMKPLPIFLNINDVYSIDMKVYKEQSQRVHSFLEQAFPKRPREEPRLKQGATSDTAIFVHDRSTGDVTVPPNPICSVDAERRWYLDENYKRNDPPKYDGNTASGHCSNVWQANVYNRAAFLATTSNWIIDCGCGGGLKAVELYKRGYNLVLIERPGPNLAYAKAHIKHTERYASTGGDGVYFVELISPRFTSRIFRQAPPMPTYMKASGANAGKVTKPCQNWNRWVAPM